MPVYVLSLIHELALRLMYGTYELLYKGAQNHKFSCNCPVCQSIREAELADARAADLLDDKKDVFPLFTEDEQ